MDTVGEAIDYLYPYVGQSGQCDREETLIALNESRKLLWDLTDYRYIVEYICVRCAGSCFYLPSAYSKVILAWFGKETVSLGDEWYNSLPGVGYQQNCSCHRKIVDVGGYHVTFQNFEEAPYQIALVAESPLDNGVEITTTGTNEYATRIQENIKLDQPPTMAKSTMLYKAVLSITKPKTKGRVRLYAYNPNNGRKMLLAIYQPYDTNPNFRKLSIQGNRCCTITLYVKKKYYPLEHDYELVEFPKQALIMGVMAMSFLHAKNTEEYAKHRELAKAEINISQTDQENLATAPLRWFNQNIVQNII